MSAALPTSESHPPKRHTSLMIFSKWHLPKLLRCCRPSVVRWPRRLGSVCQQCFSDAWRKLFGKGGSKLKIKVGGKRVPITYVKPNPTVVAGVMKATRRRINLTTL